MATRDSALPDEAASLRAAAATPHAGDDRWRYGVYAPLSIAAYVTWAAVLMQALSPSRLAGGDAREWAGVAAMLLFLALFVLRARCENETPANDRRAGLLSLLQGGVAVLATALLDSTALSILLIIVAAQVSALWRPSVTVAWMLIFNAAVVAYWWPQMTLRQLILFHVPIIGFQAFAALTSRYAIDAQRARDALAQTNAQLMATRELLDQSARDAERLKLSRELHDVAGHKLTALKLNLARLQRDAALAARDEVRTSGELATELLDDIRAVVGELRKHDGIDLGAALRTLARQIPGARVRIDIDATARVDDVDTAQTLLRCAQEGITNALRHGRPTQVVVSCVRDGARWRLSVRDDGSARPLLRFGNGLTGMRERLHERGGELVVRASPGRGVELIATVPVRG